MEILITKDSPLTQLIHRILDEYPFIDDTGSVNEAETWEVVVPLLHTLQQVTASYIESKDKTYEEHSRLIFSALENIFFLSTEEHALLVSLSKTLQPFVRSSCSLTIFIEFCLDFLSHIPGHSQLYNQPGPFIGSLNSLSLIPKGYTFILGANKKITHSIPVFLLILLSFRKIFYFPPLKMRITYIFYRLSFLQNTSSILVISLHPRIQHYRAPL